MTTDSNAQTVVNQERRPNPYTALREIYPNAGRAWSAEQDNELRQFFRAGHSTEELMKLLGRTRNAIVLRLERLGLVQPKIPV